MTPHEMSLLDFDINKILNTFGWTRREIEVQHEREWSMSSRHIKWYDRDGNVLFDESHITKAFLDELLIISQEIESLKSLQVFF